MELAVRVGGRRCGEITDKPAQPDGGYIPVSGADVKKAISKPPDSGEIDSDFIRRILKESFPRLRKPVVKNLAWITMAFINVLEGLRSGNGKLTLASIARGLPFQGKFKMLYQKVSRFLRNKFLDPGCLTEGLFTMLMGEGARGMLPVIVDQTTVAGVLAILAGVAFSGRVFPVGIFTYTNKDIEDRPDREKSRNYIETLFMLRMLEACPVDLVLLFVLDRGYARVSLMRELLATSGVLFLMRAPKNVVVRYRKVHKEVKVALGSIRVRHREMIRLSRALYRGAKSVQVDIVIYWEKNFKAPWYLVLPPGSDDVLPTQKVVELYRSRMRVEQGFRDFKHHLGIRGLKLEVDQAERLGRLLQGFLLAYTIALALGETKVGYAARERFETARKEPRHGTTRILSAFRIGSLLLTGLVGAELVSLEFKEQIRKTVKKMKKMLLSRQGLYFIVEKL